MTAILGLGPADRPALVLHCCQRAMLDPAAAPGRGLARHAAERGIVLRLAALAAAFRQAGLPVVHTVVELDPDEADAMANCLELRVLAMRGDVRPGSPGAEIHPALTPDARDARVRCVRGLTPFFGTGLDGYLREQRVTTVVLGGTSSELGIPGAALEAVNFGFRVVVVEDAIAGSSPQLHDWQVAHTLPLLATVASGADVLDALPSDVALRSA